jgi:integrase
MILQDTTCPSISNIETFSTTGNESWSQRYGEKHRLEWIKDFPKGITPPKRVRIYGRAEHYVLQWWDPAAKQNLSDRVDDDLVAAISRARQIEERLQHFKSSRQGTKKVAHAHLLEKYTGDLRGQADAGQIDPGTVSRYESALRHYRSFIDQAEILRKFPHIAGANREFALAFGTYLTNLQVAANGHPHSPRRPLQRQDYVLDVVRAMYEWAGDPQRGNLMPEGFCNPFFRRSRSSRSQPRVQLGDPDITLSMAVDFIQVCDAYQLRLFAPHILYGLRAAEPCFLFHEQLDENWLKVSCLPELGYHTKGRRDKHLPLLPEVADLWKSAESSGSQGLLYVRRGVLRGLEKPPLLGASLTEMIQQYRQRSAAANIRTAADRRGLRDRIFREAGGINYDQIVTEFGKLAAQLDWPPSATLKDFRHLFATCLENTGMPEHYRQFLMGQSPGRSAIVYYTHLNEIQERFAETVQRTMQPLVAAIQQRAAELRQIPV